MKMFRRQMILGAAALAFASAPALAGQAGDGIMRLAVQVSDSDPKTYTKALNVVTNFARGMSAKGELYEIEVVAFNAGLHILREDTSPVMDRIKSISESIPEVSFSACGNTLANMTKAEGKEPPLTEYAVVVPGGVGRLIHLDNAGYFVIRP